jgi:hypothetical protein
LDIPDAELLPVRSARRDGVGEKVPVRGGLIEAQRKRAVGAGRVHVEEDARLSIEILAHVQHGLVLKPRVLEREVAILHLHGRRILGVVPDALEPLADGCALRQRLEVTEGQGVLGVDPDPRFGGVGVLEPSIRIRNGSPVEGVDDVATRRGRIAKWRGPGWRLRQSGGGEGKGGHRQDGGAGEQRHASAGKGVKPGGEAASEENWRHSARQCPVREVYTTGLREGR